MRAFSSKGALLQRLTMGPTNKAKMREGGQSNQSGTTLYSPFSLFSLPFIVRTPKEEKDFADPSSK
jgi:hypothetical protein